MQEAWLEDIANAQTSAEIDAVRVKLLGKSGLITQQLKLLSSLSPEEKREGGLKWNAVRRELEESIQGRLAHIKQAETAERLKSEKLDVTLPPAVADVGHSHILTRARFNIASYFKGFGFEEASGPEVDDAYYNFDALNIPEHHPARQSHDTFYTECGKLLRTHTSNVQVRVLKKYAKKPNKPLRCLSIGRVYRSDAIDATHTPMFHQIEGLVIDEGINFSHLKGCITDFCNWFFGECPVRFRASFFPFTEPSAEVDVSFKGRWLEVLGCGMIHPNVLKEAGLDPSKVQGFAFGMGLERLTMMKHGISDIRHLYETDVRWLKNS